MGTLSLKREQYFRRRKRSKKAFPVEGEYRLCVYKSSKHIEAQIIDDFNQKTIVASSSKEKIYGKKKATKIEMASLVGKELADRAKLVKEANTAKKVAFKCEGAFFAIQANKGIIETCPRGDSRAVFIIAINLASTIPFVSEDVQL